MEGVAQMSLVDDQPYVGIYECGHGIITMNGYYPGYLADDEITAIRMTGGKCPQCR